VQRIRTTANRFHPEKRGDPAMVRIGIVGIGFMG